MIIIEHCCTSGRFHHAYPLIYTLGLPIVTISYIMAILFWGNLCNALSEFHGISDVQSRTLTYLDRCRLDDGYVYDMAENDVDFSCYSSALMQGYSCDSCHRQPNSGTKFKRLCPSHAHLAGLWLLDSGASDHSTPYLEDFLTYKKLAKPVRVQTAGKEIIWFPGIGTVAFTTTVQG